MYGIVPRKSFNEIFDSVLEFFSSALKVDFFEGQNKFEPWCFGESSVVEVTIRENSMKTVGVTVTGLIQKSDILGLVFFVLELSFEDVGDFGLRLRC